MDTTQLTSAVSKQCSKGHVYEASRTFCPECGRSGGSLHVSGGSTAATEAVQRTAATADPVAESAQTSVKACCFIGFVVTVLGGLIAGLGLDEQSVGALVFGLFLAGIGQLTLLIAVIATGVRLGVASANQSR